MSGHHALVLDVRAGVLAHGGVVVDEVLHGQYWVYPWMHIEAALAFPTVARSHATYSDLGDPHLGVGFHLAFPRGLRTAFRFQLGIPTLQWASNPVRRANHELMTHQRPEQPSLYHEDRLDLISSLHLRWERDWFALQLDWGVPVSVPLSGKEDPNHNPHAAMLYGLQCSFRLVSWFALHTGVLGTWRWERDQPHDGAATFDMVFRIRPVFLDLYLLVPYDQPGARIDYLFTGLRVGVSFD